MIRKAVPEDFNELYPDSEAAVRILSLVNAYGTDQPFIRLWSITEGDSCKGFLSLLDGAAVLADVKENAITESGVEEIAAFLLMQNELQYIRTSLDIGQKIRVYGDWRLESGTVMTPENILQSPLIKPEKLSPRDIYPILVECFGDEMPPFSPWYVDVSHKVRHGCCRIMGFCEKNEPAACAMTTAECSGAAIIGAVATMPAKRGNGYASAIVLTLAHELLQEGRHVYLSPKNEAAHSLYTRLGFKDCGKWASLSTLN